MSRDIMIVFRIKQREMFKYIESEMYLLNTKNAPIIRRKGGIIKTKNNAHS